MILLAVPALAAWALASSALLARRYPTVQVPHQEPLGPMVPTFREQSMPVREEHHFTHAA